MGSASGVYRLQLAVAAGGIAVVGLALATALRPISLDAPSLAAIAEACRGFALPHVTPTAVAVLLVASLSFAALALAARSLWWQLRARRRFLAALDVAGPGPGGSLLVATATPLAFCTGFLRPRVYISRGAVALLGESELQAVLAHETHHARRRDPLRICISRALADGLFFLPALGSLAKRYEALAEIAADEAAVRRMRSKQPLASALLAFEAAPTAAVVGIAPERVDHLLGQPARWQLPTAILAGTAVTLAALLAVTFRLAAATEHASVSLPLLVAQACMLAMALAAPALGAAALLGSRRLFRRRHR